MGSKQPTLTESIIATMNKYWDELDTPNLILKKIRDGADVNAQDKYGNSVLHRFVLHKAKPECITELVREHGANLEIKNKVGKTPLAELLDTKCTIGQVMLLIRLGADPTTTDSEKLSIIERLKASKTPDKTMADFERAVQKKWYSLGVGDYKYSTLSQWHEPKSPNALKAQEKLNRERDESMERMTNRIFKL